jgi:hypothetical protein
MNNNVAIALEVSAVNAVLNANRIIDDIKADIVKAMGMSACQARCFHCNKCASHAGRG